MIGAARGAKDSIHPTRRHLRFPLDRLWKRSLATRNGRGASHKSAGDCSIDFNTYSTFDESTHNSMSKDTRASRDKNEEAFGTRRAYNSSSGPFRSRPGFLTRRFL